MVRPPGRVERAELVPLDPLDLELLPRLDAIALPDLGRKHDLAFGG